MLYSLTSWYSLLQQKSEREKGGHVAFGFSWQRQEFESLQILLFEHLNPERAELRRTSTGGPTYPDWMSASLSKQKEASEGKRIRR